MSALTKPQVRAGQVWSDCERGRVRVIAVADGYAMLKRRRRNPFLASVDQINGVVDGEELKQQRRVALLPGQGDSTADMRL